LRILVIIRCFESAICNPQLNMPDWKPEIRKRLAALRLAPTRENTIVEELAQHLDDCYAELLAGGVTAAEAERRTRAELSGSELLQWELRRVERQIDLEPIVLGTNRRTKMLANLWQDLRYGARMLAKKPGFTVLAVLILALGIGANTAIFSVVNTVLWRRLPYDATRLVAVNSFAPQKDSRPINFSAADYWDWREQSQTFENLAAYSSGVVALKVSERVEMLSGARVTTNFFATFGVQPLLGRSFTSEEGLLSGPPAVVLSHRLWQQRYGGDPQIVGGTLKTDNGAITVVGVMPPDFKFPSYAEAWTPLKRDSGEMKSRTARYFEVIGRIKPEQTIESAQAELKAVAARLAEAFPKDNQGRTALLTDWRESLVQDSRKALLVLLGAVAFVLLIACANVANLLLTAAAARRKEMAIRLALGAARWTLIRQLLAESLLLAILGGALGFLLAIWGVDVLTRWLPEVNFSFQALAEMRNEIRLDHSVLLFTLVVSCLTGLIFGLAPGWQAAKTDVNESLKQSSRGSSTGHQRTRHALVVAEVALALVLLVGAGLLLSSFARMLQVDPGYDPQGLMVVSLSLPAQNNYPIAQQVMERIAATPGVASVALMSFPTLGGLGFPFNRENQPLPNGDVMVAYSAISPNYLRTLKTPLRAGRNFDDRDLPNAPPVALINETMARQYFAGENPIGQKLIIATFLNQRLTREIVGVVGDVKQEEPNKPTKPEILVPFAQLPWGGGSLLVRSIHPDPLTVKSAVQQAIWSVNPAAPESRARALSKTLAEQVAEPRLYALLLSLFAGIALLLAAVGIYSVLAYSVAQRTQEFGIRLALGAQGSDVLKLVIRQGLKLALLGIGVGLAGALALTRLLKTLLFNVSATDPATFGLIALLLIAVALVACWLPARRATQVDPLVALRSE
jgi:putative ABC transport system permease protein